MIRIGTRGSPLALAQAGRVQNALQGSQDGACELVVVKTEGDRDTYSPLDRPANAGVFTSALTEALLADRIDLAVHSLKDLPLGDPEGTCLAAYLPRDDPADLLLVREEAWDPVAPLHLKPGSRIGSSAPRRQSQLLEERPDLVPLDVRGNVGRRIALIEAGILDALVMAAAVHERMEIGLPKGVLRIRLDPMKYPPAPGQAVIAVQARVGSDAARVVALLDDASTRLAVTAERDLLARLGGGCGLPLGVHAGRAGTMWCMHATFGRDRGPSGLVRVEAVGEDLSLLEDKVASDLMRSRENGGGDDKSVQDSGALGNLRSDAPLLVVILEEQAAARYQRALGPVGWRVVPWPLIETEPTGKRMPSLAQGPFWIAVTSARAAPFAAQAAWRTDGSWRPVRVAAGGPATALALREAGLPVHALARDGSGRGLAREIARFPGDPLRVLWPAAEEPAGGLEEEAGNLGLEIVHWPVYRVVQRAPIPEFPVRPRAQALLVTSPSNARALREMEVPEKIADRWFAIGETTAQAMREERLPLSAVARDPSPAGVQDLLEQSKVVEIDVDEEVV